MKIMVVVGGFGIFATTAVAIFVGLGAWALVVIAVLSTSLVWHGSTQ